MTAQDYEAAKCLVELYCSSYVELVLANEFKEEYLEAISY